MCDCLVKTGECVELSTFTLTPTAATVGKNVMLNASASAFEIDSELPAREWITIEQGSIIASGYTSDGLTDVKAVPDLRLHFFDTILGFTGTINTIPTFALPNNYLGYIDVVGADFEYAGLTKKVITGVGLGFKMRLGTSSKLYCYVTNETTGTVYNGTDSFIFNLQTRNL
jgi:hypothetical protein